jgi:hypothetical protein
MGFKDIKSNIYQFYEIALQNGGEIQDGHPNVPRFSQFSSKSFETLDFKLSINIKNIVEVSFFQRSSSRWRHHPLFYTFGSCTAIKKRQSAAMVSRYFKGLRYVMEIQYPKKIKDWKIDEKLLHFINEFMKNRTLRVTIGNTLSEEKQIENGLVQGAVLSVPLFLVAMAEITHGIEEPIKIIGYPDDWIIHNTHKHERVSIVKLQKAMDEIVKWSDDTGFQISIEKSRINSAIASRPRLDIWIRGTNIEQVRKHTILGLIFDT